MPDMRLIKWVTVLLTINFFDMITTVIGLTSGFAQEINPLMAYVWHLSPISFVALKLLIPLLLLLELLRRARKPHQTLVALRSLSLLFLAVVLWNSGTLLVIRLFTT